MSITRFALTLGAFEIVLILLYAFCTDYASNLDASAADDGGIQRFYPFFTDVHVMVFVGFGFLMTFARRYGFSAVGYNFLFAALALQWAILTNGFWEQVNDGKDWHTIELDVPQLITGDFGAAAFLITFGALLGRTSPFQLFVIVVFEMIFFSMNEYIGAKEFQAVDMGGSMFVHTFGAYFGLGVSLILGKKGSDSKLNGSRYTSDLFAMIGTLFLWMFWPSFNGALAAGASQHRVVVNTVLSIATSCAMAFVASALLRKGHKFDMVDIQNATLAGGVAIGSSSDLVIEPWGAILIGFLAGLLSVFGYVYVSPFLDRLGIADTCGVNNLHGMPGMLGGVAGIFSALDAGDTEYGTGVGLVFPARASSNPSASEIALGIEPGEDRSAEDQAGYQAAALFVTLGISFFGGMLVGAIVRQPFFNPPTKYFDDDEYWELPEHEEHDEHNGKNGFDDVATASSAV